VLVVSWRKVRALHLSLPFFLLRSLPPDEESRVSGNGNIMRLSWSGEEEE